MDWFPILLWFGKSLVITLFAYLLVPIVIVLSGKKFDAKQIKRISIINCIVVWLLFRILQISMGDDTTSGAAVFIWGTVGYRILLKRCLKVTSPSHQAEETPKNLSLENEKSPLIDQQDVHVSNLALNVNTPINNEPSISVKHKVTPTVVRTAQPTKHTKYCSRCGKPIDPKTKKCQGCGKQYFKGVPWKSVFSAILILLLICSLSANVLLYLVCDDFSSEKKELAEKLEAVQEENEKLSQELKDSYKQFNEINRLVVFVEDDGTNLFHKFQCEKFVGKSFWAYNIELAKGKGYEPCSSCNKTSSDPALSWDEEYDYLMIAHAVGDDYEISTTELKNLPIRERGWLMSPHIVFICSTWKGLYHSMFCDRLTGTCRVTVRPIAETEDYKPCPHCLK